MYIYRECGSTIGQEECDVLLYGRCIYRGVVALYIRRNVMCYYMVGVYIGGVVAL